MTGAESAAPTRMIPVPDTVAPRPPADNGPAKPAPASAELDGPEPESVVVETVAEVVSEAAAEVTPEATAEMVVDDAPAPSGAAEVFATLLAAEQGEAGSGSGRTLDAGEPAVVVLSADTLEQLALRLEQRLAHVVRDGAATGVRTAVADADVGGAAPDAVHEAVRAAVTSVLPGLVAEALSAAVQPHVRDIVRETSERLVREEIARIRNRAG